MLGLGQSEAMMICRVVHWRARSGCWEIRPPLTNGAPVALARRVCGPETPLKRSRAAGIMREQRFIYECFIPHAVTANDFSTSASIIDSVVSTTPGGSAAFFCKLRLSVWLFVSERCGDFSGAVYRLFTACLTVHHEGLLRLVSSPCMKAIFSWHRRLQTAFFW